MTLPRNFRSTLQKYAFNTKNPTGAGLPKSLTAATPKPPVPTGLTEQAQNFWSSPAAKNAKPQPAKLLGAGAPSIGAPGTMGGNNNSIFSAQPKPSPMPAQPTPPVQQPAAPMAPPPGTPPTMLSSVNQTTPPTGTLSLAPGDNIQTGQPAAAQPTQPAPSSMLTLSGGSAGTVSAQPPTPAATQSMTQAIPPAPEPAAPAPQPEQAPPASAAPPTNNMAETAQTAPQQQPAAPKTPEQQQQADTDLMARMNDPNVPDADKKQAAQQHVQQLLDGKPEMKQGMADLHAGKDTPQAKQFQAEVDKAGNAYIREEFARLKAENPAAGPQEQGSMMNSVMEGWNNMPTEMKWMMGLGVGGGLLGMLGSMFGGGGGMGLLGLLGLGVGGLAGAAGGMFGQDAQNMTADALSGIGKFTGMMPEKLTDEQKKILLAKDPTAQITGAGGWSVPTRATAAKQVADGKQQLDQIQMLNRMGGMTPRMLENMGLSADEAQIAARNVGTLSADYANPDSALNKHIQRGESYAQPGWGNAAAEWTVGNSYMPWNWGANKTSSVRVQQLISGWANKSAFNAADQKELNDLEAWQMKTKKYDLEKTRRLKELQDRQAASYPPQDIVKICMKSARCWAGYEPVPGKAPYSENSCRPVGSKKKKKKTEKKAEEIADEWLKKYRARGQKGRWVNTQRSVKKEHKISNK